MHCALNECNDARCTNKNDSKFPRTAVMASLADGGSSSRDPCATTAHVGLRVNMKHVHACVNNEIKLRWVSPCLQIFQFCNDRAYNRPCIPSSMKDPLSLGINTNLWHITEAHGYVLEDSGRYEILRKLAVLRTWYRELRANIVCFEASNLLLLAW